MITIRPIQSEQIDDFVAVGNQPLPIQNSIKAYLENMLAQGATRLEWCFILEIDGVPAGRAAYWTLPGHSKPSDIILLELPWHRADCPFIGKQLIQHMLSATDMAGVDQIGYVVDSPCMAPQWQDCLPERIDVLKSIGFRLQRETSRFEWKAGESAAADTGDLTFCSLSEVGEAAFVEAIWRGSCGTLDRQIAREREESGEQRQAWDFLRDLQRMTYDPLWWQLAYTQEEELIGFVMPAKSPTFATIGYIGVLPEHRGRGYIDHLLNRVSLILTEAGESYIRADTDVANAPMAQAFLRAGYRKFANRREYSLRLPFCDE